MRRLLHVVLLALSCLVVGGAPATAQRETITDFRSDIVIEQDGSLTVTETITAIAAGDRIKHGIYRDFPTSYAGPLGLRETVGFELVGAQRDGRFEPTTIKPLDNGVRLYLGDPGRFVAHGPHTWTITYRTTRQLRFLDTIDELYWNVTGNGWAFPIERVTARIELPGRARLVNGMGYTGYSGDTGGDYSLITDDLGMPVFTTTRPLRPEEGLTVAVSWPKGFVAELSSEDRLATLFADNRALLVGVGGLALVTLYFLVMWWRVGRDPAKGVIFPRFEAPHGWSPVATGYVANNGLGTGFTTSEAFSVALTSLAIKGAISLTEEGDDVVIKRGAQRRSRTLAPGEAAVLEALFKGRSQVVLGGSYDPHIEKTVQTLRKVANREYAGDYIRANVGVWLPGAVLCLASVVAALSFDVAVSEDIFPVVILFAFAAAFSTVSLKLLRNALESGGGLDGVLRNLVAPLIFFAPVVVIVGLSNSFISWPVIAIVTLLVATTLLFLYLLRAPTMQGRAVLDAIEGYRRYLSVAEEDRLAMAAREPRMTIETFERHLPYAMALGVADAWTRKFVSRIDLTAPGSPASIDDYRPTWYAGYGPVRGVTGLASHISDSLTSHVSSAATAPSSASSGSGGFSGGGGSSGGGGGGGGGGGW